MYTIYSVSPNGREKRQTEKGKLTEARATAQMLAETWQMTIHIRKGSKFLEVVNP